MPIWNSIPETASRKRGRIEAVLNYAIAKKYMAAPNPAAWSGNLNALLPSKSKTMEIKHHPALQLKDARRSWSKLMTRDGQGRNALMMPTLTAVRSGKFEACIGMKYSCLMQTSRNNEAFVEFGQFRHTE